MITDVHTGEIIKTWCFVMTLCGSRHQYAELVRDQSTATWLACHRHAFEAFGGVVGRVIIDNPNAPSPGPVITTPKSSAPTPTVPRGMGSGSSSFNVILTYCKI